MGTFSFDELFPGQFTIKVTRDAYHFEPASTTFTVEDKPVTIPDIIGVRTEPVDVYTASVTVTSNVVRCTS